MQQLIGSRLKKAREETGLSQGAFAKSLGLSSEYISLLEAGKRTPSFETLDKIARFLNKEIPYFFERREPAFTMLFRGELFDDRSKAELQRFRRYCEKYVDLEAVTGRRLELAPLYTSASPERMADEERARLGLGNEPIRDIFALAELNGCRILRHPLPAESKVSGVFVFIEEKNAAFALVNSADTPGRQAFTAAHEYCHYLKDRLESPVIDSPDVFVDEYVSLYPPREPFAQAFAARFLMPPAKVREIVDKEIKPRPVSFDDVLFLKRYFGVSAQAMLRTLRNLNYLRRERFEEFFKRDPGPREKELFGGVTDGGEHGGGAQGAVRTKAAEGKAAPGSRTRLITSDRYKLLEREAARVRESRRKREKEEIPEEPPDTQSHFPTED
ncbi:MAG: helix-turn-helix domain-containing protein [Candidatus Aminicenantales bacterium]